MYTVHAAHYRWQFPLHWLQLAMLSSRVVFVFGLKFFCVFFFLCMNKIKIKKRMQRRFDFFFFFFLRSFSPKLSLLLHGHHIIYVTCTVVVCGLFYLVVGGKKKKEKNLDRNKVLFFLANIKSFTTTLCYNHNSERRKNPCG